MSAHKVEVTRHAPRGPLAFCVTCGWSYGNPASVTDVRQHATWHRQQTKRGAA